MDRPNILFILTDDHAAHAMSCYGSRINETPNLDRIAAEGETTEEVLALVYMQGAAEALDSFDMDELLHAVAREGGAVAEGLEA